MQMKALPFVALLAAVSLAGPALSRADDQDTDRDSPKAFIKDSAITAKIKAKLAEEHLTSLAKIHVDTDRDGIVWLSGTAKTQDAVDLAGRIAKDTKDVRAVRNHIRVADSD
jgi:hyperosmotically inducible protein